MNHNHPSTVAAAGMVVTTHLKSDPTVATKVSNTYEGGKKGRGGQVTAKPSTFASAKDGTSASNSSTKTANNKSRQSRKRTGSGTTKGTSRTNKKKSSREKEAEAGVKSKRIAEAAIQAIKGTDPPPPPIQCLIRCCAPPEFVEDARKLLSSNGVGLNPTDQAAYCILSLLNKHSTFADFEKACDECRSGLLKAIDEIKDGKYKGRGNLGNGV